MDHAARQFLRALRGKRSQVAFSRRLGYRSNVAAKWEGGHRFPTFSETMRAAERVGVDVTAALTRFHPASAAAWEPDQIHPWLRSLRGATRQTDLAQRSGLSRQQIGRLLSGHARGRLPEVMALVDAMTGRLPDLVGAIVPIAAVSELAREAASRSALSRLAITHPWSPAAQAWLESVGTVSVSSAPTQLARALGIEREAAQKLLKALIRAGIARQRRGRIQPLPPVTVELRATPEDLQNLRAHWSRVSANRIARAAPDLFSFNVFALSREDLVRVQEAQRRFYREVRAIVSDSPPEVAAMLVVHTAAFDEEGSKTALSPGTTSGSR